jgi:fused signal recognition particle receptor
MEVKGKRIEVEKRRKEYKAEALAWNKKVDTAANKIFKLLEPIETHLQAEEDKITKEKARIKAEEERRIQEVAQDRVNQMAQFGKVMPFAEALSISDGEFFAKLNIAKSEYEAEQARLTAENKAREEEAARLAAERAELERLRKEEAAKRKAEEDRLAAERAKIEADRMAVEAAKREQERLAELERAKKEAAEKAIKEAVEKAEREAKAKAEAERLAQEEAARQEALRPDKEKLVVFAKALLAVIDGTEPGLSDEAAKAVFSEAAKRIEAVYRYIIKSAKEL